MPAHTDREFLDIIHRALAGDHDAAAILFEEYREPLRMVIRVKLDRKLRRVFDSVDFLQDVFLEAFAGKLADKDFHSPQAFLGHLRKIAERRVQNTVRKQLLAQRSPFAREVPLNTLQSDLGATDGGAGIDDGNRAEQRQRLGRLPLVHRAIM